ncbi:MAG: aminotransferase class III-fold pyridoxal phosphate-dependent enzyme [Cyanobacteria bacterium J06638_38]
MLDVDRSQESVLAKSEVIPSSPTKDLTQMDVESLWHPMVQHKKYDHSPPKRMDRAQGCYVTDSAGKEYLDGVSGLWCVNVGYGRKELADAAQEQLW